MVERLCSLPHEFPFLSGIMVLYCLLSLPEELSHINVPVTYMYVCICVCVCARVVVYGGRARLVPATPSQLEAEVSLLLSWWSGLCVGQDGETDVRQNQLLSLSPCFVRSLWVIEQSFVRLCKCIDMISCIPCPYYTSNEGTSTTWALMARVSWILEAITLLLLINSMFIPHEKLICVCISVCFCIKEVKKVDGGWEHNTFKGLSGFFAALSH